VSVPGALTPEQLEQLAHRVADIVAERLQASDHARVVDAQGLANVLGVSPDWVRAHADELGARRLGDGPRGRLRFDLDHAVELFHAGATKPRARVPASPPRRRPRRTPDRVDLLPVRDEPAGRMA
jgi:hypothetical protein